MRATSLAGAAAFAAATLMLPAPAAAINACSPHDLAARAIAHELDASRHGTPYMFRETQRTNTGTRIREVIQGADFRIRRLIGRDGQELSADDRASETARLERLAADAESGGALAQYRENGSRMRELLRAAPQAFLFDCRGDITLPSGDRAIQLGFTPNPSYTPDTRSLRVLTGMVGTIVIDPKTERVISLDANLVRDVDFGWGILGRLYRGGHVSLRQEPLGPDRWVVKSLAVHFDGRVMLLKRLHIDTLTTTSDYRLLSQDITWRRGVKLLISGR